MFLVSDDYGNVMNIASYVELKDMLIDEIMEDIKANYTEYEIVKACVEQLGELAKGIKTCTLEYLKDQLQSYGWYVQDLSELQRDINNLREYYARKNNDLKAFDDILDLLDKGVK